MSEKKVPNRYGRLGSPPHQDKVDEVAEDIESRGFAYVKGCDYLIDVLSLSMWLLLITSRSYKSCTKLENRIKMGCQSSGNGIQLRKFMRIWEFIQNFIHTIVAKA